MYPSAARLGLSVVSTMLLAGCMPAVSPAPAPTRPAASATAALPVARSPAALASAVPTAVVSTPTPILPLIQGSPTAGSGTASPSDAARTDRLAAVSSNWGKDWGAVIAALEPLAAEAPGNAEYRDKLYAAYLAEADRLTALWQPDEAERRLRQAEALDADRPEAPAKLAELAERRAGERARAGEFDERDAFLKYGAALWEVYQASNKAQAELEAAGDDAHRASAATRAQASQQRFADAVAGLAVRPLGQDVKQALAMLIAARAEYAGLVRQAAESPTAERAQAVQQQAGAIGQAEAAFNERFAALAASLDVDPASKFSAQR